MTKEKYEVIKARGAIQISHEVSLMQQQLWNVLLAHAFPQLGTQQEFTIPTATLLMYFPSTRNTQHLKECLEGLVKTTVRYNVFDSERREWGVFSLLAEGILREGVCTYAYAPLLQEKLNNPAVYAKINLMIQNRFESKYSLFLYELCVDYRGVHQTPWMEIEKFRKYMGVTEEQYPEFKRFNQWAIQPAVKEINQKSDLQVKVEYKRQTRKIAALKFHIENNPDHPPLVGPQLPETLPPAPQEPPQPQPAAETSPLLKELLSLNLPESQALSLLKQYPETAVLKAIAVVKTSRKPIENPGGFIVQALQQGWEAATPYDSVQVAEQQRQQEEQKLREAQLRQARQDYEAKSAEEKLQFIIRLLSGCGAYAFLQPANKHRLQQRLREEIIEAGVPLEPLKERVEALAWQALREQEHFPPPLTP